MTMSLIRFNELLDAYGADPERWPLEDRVGATELLARSSEARALARRAGEIDDLLDATPLNLPSSGESAALVSRIMDALPVTRPQPGMRFGWPNWAALAAASIAGLMIGWSGLNVGPGLAATDAADLLAPTPTLEDTLW